MKELPEVRISRDDAPAALSDLLHCLARALQGEMRQRTVEQGLLPVHGQVLGFLRAANRYSNTLQVLAEYLGQTKGTVSQTVQWLERKGLVRREADARDRRVTRLSLTGEGRRVLAAIEADGAWSAALGALGGKEAAAATTVLTGLLRHWQAARGGATFGVCRSCAHFRVEGAATFRCGLTGDALSAFDSGQICREHRVPEQAQ
jgi:DNA-binding MarR family transcriptional regulator